MADADKKTKVQVRIETVIDEKQVKQEVDTAQKIADANKVTIPVETKKVTSEDMKQEVKTVQKEVSKTSVEIPVKLTKKEVQDELNKLIKQKGKSQEEIRTKLDDIMKGMDLSDAIKDSIKSLFVKYRSMANSKKGFSSASTKSKDEFVAEVTNFSKKTQNKKSNSLVKVLNDLTAGQAQVYRNEKRTPTQLKNDKENILSGVRKAQRRKEEARQGIQKAHFRKDSATQFVEGRPDADPPYRPLKEVYEEILDGIHKRAEFVSSHTSGGKNEKAVKFWGTLEPIYKLMADFEKLLNDGLTEYNNRETFVPEAEANYERISEEVLAIEAEALKRLDEINKALGPIEKIIIDPSKMTPKRYQELFKEPLPPQKFKIKPRTLTDDVADAATNRDFFKKLARGASRGKSNVPGADINLGLRQSVTDGPYVDKQRIVRTAIGGPYADTNSYVRNAMETQKASYKLARDTLNQFIVSVQTLQTYLDNLTGRNKNNFTEEEKNKHLSQIATDQAVKEQKKISKGLPTADVQAFQDALKASFGFLIQSLGPSIWKGLSQNVNAIMSQFAGGTFKITDDETKGEGENYAELAEVLSQNFKDINEFFAKNPEMEQLAEAARQLKMSAELGVDAFEQTLKDNAQILRSFGYNPGRIVASTSDKPLTPGMNGNTMLTKHILDMSKKIEYGTNFIKIGNVEGEETTESIKLTDTTGTDSEAGKNEVVEATKQVSATIKSQWPGKGAGIGGGNNFGGGSGSSSDIGDSGPSILEQIRDILSHIAAYTTAIFDILPKLKLTIKREKRSKKKDTTIPEPEPDPSLYPVVAGELKDLSPRSTRVWADATRPKKYNEFSEESKEREVLDAQRKKVFSKPYNTEEEVKRIEDTLSTPTGESRVEISQDISEIGTSFGDMIKKAFGMTTATAEVDRIKNLNQSQREAELANRRRMFGIADSDRNAAATGDKARAFRMKSIYGYNKQNNPFADLKLTPGLNVDTEAITDAFHTMISKNMFSAQTGVNGFGDLLKLSFGGIGMPSLEKSRAQADGANEILAIIRQVVQELIQAIQGKETELRGMESQGDAKFDDKGKMISGTNEAWTAFGQLEESKMALNSVIAEMGMMDQLSEATGGNMTEFFKVLGFVAPELRKCNGIIKNINAGLDKNGKAIKFQSRFQETLNYSFQLLTRHVGQMIKNWMMLLNPINLIKKAFGDFASYDVKWQRTMNVIKYNLRRIIRPMMEWIAQQLVNMIGLVNALIKGIGSAFGQNWDLFDKDAANAEKIREEMEAAANVSAGFDELHDIGGESGNDPAMDFSGDIYTPQWDGLNKVLEDIGTTIGNIINAVSDWTFWDWLILAGAAVGGFLALKWLIGLFSNKNPLQSVADGFKSLQTTVGWAVLIASFAAFVKVLTEFVECMKTTNWEDVGRSLAMLGGALGELTVAIVALIGFAKLFGTEFLTLLGFAAIIAAFALLTVAIAYFIETVSKISNATQALQMLSGILLVVVGVVILLLAVFTALIATGVGAAAVAALAAILAAVALVIAAIALVVVALGEYSNEIIAIMQTAGAIIISILQTIMNGIQQIILTVVLGIVTVITTIGNTIVTIIQGVADAIMTVLQPIMDFIDGIIDKVLDLAKTIAQEIGKTIRTVIETVGEIIIGIINAIVNAIPTLLNAILNFVRQIGPAIEGAVDSIIRSITKLINFMISGIEYMVNLVVDGMNSIIGAVNSVSQYVGIHIPRVERVSIARFVPQYEVGTNYVPHDGLAYLHEGEAVIPKKYNQPYQPGTLSPEERMYMNQMMNTMRSLDNTMKQGINVNGQFVQRGSDLVAVVNKTKSQTGADLLSNVAYAR